MAENKPIYVPDASVLLKWALCESEDAVEALQLRRDFEQEKIELLLPPHCLTEVANILGQKSYKISLEFLSYILTATIPEAAFTIEYAGLALQLMQKYKKTSFYDTAYHAVALQTGGIFITADEKYYQRVQKEKHILLLKNYPLVH